MNFTRRLKEQKENNKDYCPLDKVSNMTEKTKKALNNAIASAKMEGFDFTDEQLKSLIDLIEQVDNGKMTGREAVNSIIKKHRR